MAGSVPGVVESAWATTGVLAGVGVVVVLGSVLMGVAGVVGVGVGVGMGAAVPPNLTWNEWCYRSTKYVLVNPIITGDSSK